MDAITAIRGRRSVRAYQDKPVARELIAALIEDAAHAPFTPISKQGAWRFTVIEGAARVSAMGSRALEFARKHRPQVRGYEWTERPGFSVFHGAPVILIISGRRALPVALEECTRAGQIFEIAAHARGLGSCWVGSPMLWLLDPATRAELDIPEDWLPYATFAFGYPADGPMPPPAERPPVQVDWVDAERQTR
jgi:nitroreductase